jgi:DNA helicase-2/ATP-dependent DNA helicase PcrA
MLFGKTSAGQSSRFIGEIKSDNIETHEAPYDFERSHYTEYGKDDSSNRSQLTRQSHRYTDESQIYTPPKKQVTSSFINRPVQTFDYSVNDKIKHKAFGTGVIIDMTPAGNDSFISIEFDNGDTKKFLLNTAVRNMEKVNSEQ